MQFFTGRLGTDFDSASKNIVLVLEDHFDRLEAFQTASPGLTLELTSLAELRGARPPHAAAVFHAAPDKPGSLATLRLLREAMPEAVLVGVVHRMQAFQIGYLLESGLDRCIVEPATVGELAKALRAGRGRRG